MEAHDGHAGEAAAARLALVTWGVEHGQPITPEQVDETFRTMRK